MTCSILARWTTTLRFAACCLLASTIVSHAANLTVTYLPETSPTWPAGHSFGGSDGKSYVAQSTDPKAPFGGTACVFRGFADGGSSEMLNGGHLIYRMRLDFDEEVWLESFTSTGAGAQHQKSVMRLLDTSGTVLSAAPLTGFNAEVTTVLHAGVRGWSFLVDEFDDSTQWRFRKQMTVAYSTVTPTTPAAPTGAQVFTVTNTDDAGPGSLRQAINSVAGTTGGYAIHFNIPGTGPHVIQPGTAFADVVAPVTIDGSTQPGYAGTPQIEIRGDQAAGAGDVNGLSIRTKNCVIRALCVNSFKSWGIHIGWNPELGNNRIVGCFIGTDPTGTIRRGNGEGGLGIFNSPDNVVGGSLAGDRNIVSGNRGGGIHVAGIPGSSGNAVYGNYIGTDVTGTRAIPNMWEGLAIYDTENVMIGGIGSGLGNLISGNEGHGIALSTRLPADRSDRGVKNASIFGNRIGTDTTGTRALRNNWKGIRAWDAVSGLVIGASNPAARNLISGNGEAGIELANTSLPGALIQGNYIGTDITGTRKIPNSWMGVMVLETPGVTVGGTEPGQGNLISGNVYDGVKLQGAGSSNNVVAGNLIGTDHTGLAVLGNSNWGVFLDNAPRNRIGMAGAGNTIAGSGQDGVFLLNPGAHDNVVAGNHIGVDASGTRAFGNNHGVHVAEGARSNIIGGLEAAAGNVISGNRAAGVILRTGASANEVIGNRIGTDASGTRRVGNNYGGVEFWDRSPLNVLGGTTANHRNLISGNGGEGVILRNGSFNNYVQGNFIGTDITGTMAISNRYSGVWIGSDQPASPIRDSIIGGSEPGAGNLISGNGGFGIAFWSNAVNVRILGNRIGTDATGHRPLPNGYRGIDNWSVHGAIIGGPNQGEGNVIAFHRDPGVLVWNGTNTAIRGNSIYANGLLGIDLATRNGQNYSWGSNPNDVRDVDAGANGLQNYPVLSAATSAGGLRVRGTLNSRVNAAYAIDFYATSPDAAQFSAGGQRYLGSVAVRTDGSGNASFEPTFASQPAGVVITATATDESGNTSEFSGGLAVPSASGPRIVALSDSQAVAAGSAAMLTVAAEGTGSLRYQWYLDGGAVAGADSATLTRPAVTADQAGDYAVLVTDDTGSTWSSTVRLEVLPGWVQWRAADGGNDRYYRLTSQRLDWPAAEAEAVQLGGHLVDIDSAAEQAFLNEWLLTGPNRYTVYWIGLNDARREGTFEWSSGAPVTYRNWEANEPNNGSGGIEDWAAMNWSTADHNSGAIGSWNDAARAGTDLNSRISDGPYYGIIETGENPALAPAITAQPSAPAVWVGTELALRIQAEGAGPLSYQWRKHGVDLPGRTESVLVLTNLATVDAGEYSVIVRGGRGATISEPAAVVVWTRWATNGHYYALTAGRHHWIDAEAEARSQAGHLITVNAAEEQSWATREFVIGTAATQTFWIGFNDAQTEGRFEWVSGEPVTFTAWDSTEPNNNGGNEDYGLLNFVRARDGGGRLGGWNDESLSGDLYTTVARARGPYHGLIETAIRPALRLELTSQLPEKLDLAEGNTLELSIDAVAQGGLEYQWWRDDQPLAGATGRTLQIAPARADEGGSYRVEVTGGGLKVRSRPAVVTIYAPPRLVTQPVGHTATAGTATTLEVQAEGTLLGYQWYWNGIDLPNGREAVLSISNVQPVHEGTYRVVVTNLAGTVTSADAVLNVFAPPVIGQQPRSQSVRPGTMVSLEVGVSGREPKTYRWYRNGTAVAGATGATLTLPAAGPATEGTYWVEIANADGMARSVDATIQLEPAGGAVTFGNLLPAAGIDAPVFEFDGLTRLAGATYFAQLYAGTTLESLTAVGPAVPFREGDAAGYWVAVTRSIPSVPAGATALVQARAWKAGLAASFEETLVAGGLTGMSEILTVTTGGGSAPPADLVGLKSFKLGLPEGPLIFQQPTGNSLPAGQRAELKVAARGSAPLAYQWYRNGTLLAGQTAASLVIASFQEADQGDYSVEVGNFVSKATSATARLALILSEAAPFTVRPGDILVGNDGTGTVIKVDPATGAQTKLGDFTGVHDLTLASPTVLYVLEHAQTISRLDLQAGGKTVVSTEGLLGLKSLDTFTAGLTFGPDGFLYASVYAAPYTAILRIDPATGAQAKFASEGFMGGPIGVGFEPGGRLIVADIGSGRMLAMTTPAGTQAMLAENLGPGSPWGIAVDAQGGVYFGSAADSALNKIRYLHPVTRAVSTVAEGGFIEHPYDVALEPDGNLVIAQQEPRLIRVDRAAGRQQIISEGGFLNGSLSVIVADRFMPTQEPAIITAPTAKTVVAGASATLSVLASGAEPLTYQWRRDGYVLPEAISSSITFAAASTNDAGEYTVEVSNALGRVVSHPARLEVLVPPQFTTALAGQTVVAGAGEALRLEVLATGNPPPAYEWFKEGNPISGAAGSAFKIGVPGLGDAGNYSVQARNTAGAAVSGPVAVRVLESARIGRSPAGQIVQAGQRAQFQVEGAGTGPFTYQWRLNGQNLPGANAAVLVIDPVALEDAGAYTAVVVNEAGAVTSQPAELIVTLRPAPPGDNFADRVALAPDPEGVITSTNTFATREAGEPLHAAKPGTHSVWFAWTAPASGQVWMDTVGSSFDTLLAVYTGSTLNNLVEVANDDDHGGFFTSEVQFNAAGGVTYIIAVDGLGEEAGRLVLSWILDVAAPLAPVIRVHPASATVRAGDTVTLQVVAENAEAYQWSFRGAPIAGATGPQLVVANIAPSQVGTYEVAVSGGATLLRSREAVIEIGSDPAVRSYDKIEELLGLAGPGGLRAFAAGPPALVVSAGLPRTQIIDNTTATTQQREANHCGTIGYHSRWLAVRPDAAGILVVETPRASFPVVLAVYGTGRLGAAPLACTVGEALRLPGVAAGRTYYLAVDGANGATGAIEVECRVGLPPVAATEPPERAELRAGEQAVLQASAVEVPGPEPSYQWLRDGVPIPGATGEELPVTAEAASAQGVYSVIVDNGIGRVTNEVARLSVDLPLRLNGQGPEDWPRLDGGQFVFRLAGNPGQQVSVERTSDLAAWSPGGKFWLSADGRGEYRETVAGNGLFRARAASLLLEPNGELVKEGQPHRSWRVAGGRLGAGYVVERSLDSGASWQLLHRNAVRTSDWTFEVPAQPAVLLRVRAAED